MNKNIIIIVMLVLAAAIAIYYYSRSYQPASNMNMPQNQTQTKSPVVQSGNTNVNIQNFAFDPTPLTVKSGTVVTWTNNDSVDHQIKSSTFNSAPLANGQTFSFTFQAAGTYDYSCAIHPSMKGQIIVQ